MFYRDDTAPEWDLFKGHDEGLTNEHNLFDSVVSEFNNISGFPIYYYIKEESNTDNLYGEDANTQFSNPLKTRLVYEPTEEPTLLDVFGITSDDTIQGAFISKSVWENDVKEKYDDSDKVVEEPKAGDVITTIWNKLSYEIVHVGAESKIFQAKKLVYELVLRPYRYSEEDDDKVLFNDEEFPDITLDKEEDKDLTEYSDNTEVGEEAKENHDYSGKNTKKLYGYDTLD